MSKGHSSPRCPQLFLFLDNLIDALEEKSKQISRGGAGHGWHPADAGFMSSDLHQAAAVIPHSGGWSLSRPSLSKGFDQVHSISASARFLHSRWSTARACPGAPTSYPYDVVRGPLANVRCIATILHQPPSFLTSIRSPRKPSFLRRRTAAAPLHLGAISGPLWSGLRSLALPRGLSR